MKRNQGQIPMPSRPDPFLCNRPG